MKNAMPSKMPQQQQPNMSMNTKMPPNMANVMPPHFDFMRNSQSKYCFVIFL